MITTLGATHVLGPDGTLAPAVLELDGEHIVAVHWGGTGHAERIIAPGFIDLQVNGYADVDVANAVGEDWERLDVLLLAQGVTTWCPTLISSPPSAYPAPLARIAVAAARPRRGRPQIAGAHLEGPFLGGAIGAHQARYVSPIDADWLDALPDVVRVVTLGPEATGAPAAIAALCRRGVLVSLGHSTASYEEAEAAADAGAALVTHLFNGMAPFHHRQPGLIGAALTDDRLAVSIIADGVHLSPPALRLAFRAKPGQVALVTDAVAWQTVGLPLIGGAPRMSNGTIVGSVAAMDGCVRTAVAAGIPLAAALTAASATPAGLLGLGDRGRIGPGARADLVVLRADLSLAEVWVGGERVPPVA